MVRSRTSALLGILFLLLFCFSGVTGSTTVKEIQVHTEMTFPALFFSLSTASILLIPLAVVSMIAAIIAHLCKQRNVGFLFSLVSFLAFALFLILFAAPKVNDALYPPLSSALKESRG